MVGAYDGIVTGKPPASDPQRDHAASAGRRNRDRGRRYEPHGIEDSGNAFFWDVQKMTAIGVLRRRLK